MTKVTLSFKIFRVYLFLKKKNSFYLAELNLFYDLVLEPLKTESILFTTNNSIYYHLIKICSEIQIPFSYFLI